MNTGSLQEVQALLDKSGVRDVKFFFNKESNSSLSDAKQKVAYFLATYLRGDCELAHAVGDSKK